MGLINTEKHLFNACIAMAFIIDTAFLYAYFFDGLDFFNLVGVFIASAILHPVALPVWGLSAFVLFSALKLSQCLFAKKNIIAD